MEGEREGGGKGKGMASPSFHRGDEWRGSPLASRGRSGGGEGGRRKGERKGGGDWGMGPIFSLEIFLACSQW